MTELLKAEALTVVKRSDAGRVIIRDVSLDVYPDEILGIVGESGSGKTTTALALTGMLPASLVVQSGAAVFRGRNIYAMNGRETREFLGKDTAFICQDPSAALNPVKRIGWQIAERLVLFERPAKAEIERRVLEALACAELPATRDFLRLYPHELSGGMKQRAVIAGAIIHSPSVIIADEPTASLDESTAREILNLIRSVRQKLKCGVVFISHDMGAVNELCSRVVTIHRGKLEGGSLPPAARQALPAAPTPPSALRAPEPLAVLTNLSARYENRFSGGKKTGDVVSGISLTIGKNETVGLIGKSGSGKTTLARALSGIISYNGSYAIDGAEFSARTRKEKSRLSQIVFQNPYTSLNPAYTVARIVGEPLAIRAAVTKEERARIAREMLAGVSLDESFLTRRPHELSGGERQRVAVAAALTLAPKLLIADEILSSLDMRVQEKILALLLGLKERLGFSILFITHNTALARSFCRRIAVMDRGHITDIE